MDNGPPTLGLEDGTIDVDCLLVEPQDGHASMDSVICFNEKTPENAMDIKDVSSSFGGPNTAIAQEGEDILNGEVLDSTPNEVEFGYFRSHNDFCSMGDDYLLGVEFAESITELDYGSSEGLPASISDSQLQSTSAGSDTRWKSSLFRIKQVPDCQKDQLDIGSSKSDVPSCNKCEMLIEENLSISPGSCTLQNVGKSHNSPSCSYQDILSDGNDGRHSPSDEMFCSPKTQKNDEFEVTGQDGETNIFPRQEALTTMSVQANCTDLPTQKRSRKPTQRYVDELADPISAYSRKRREVSTSTLKDKSLGVKDHKKCHVASKAMQLPAEESSVIAIQVPFGSLVHKECPEGRTCDLAQHVDTRNLMTKSKGKRVTPDKKKKRDEFITAVHLKKGDDCAASKTRRDDQITVAHSKKSNDRITLPSHKKRNDCIIAMTPKKRDDCLTGAHQKKRDDCIITESPEEVSGRRKHHRLWSITEVRKLIDGVSQYGVGRWSRIKKLFFSTSAHRTSVDLKDKWRNLLKASGILDQGKRQGEKKRNMAWRPLPKSILRRVCELATIYPYPKGQRPKIDDDSPDRTYGVCCRWYLWPPQDNKKIVLRDFPRARIVGEDYKRSEAPALHGIARSSPESV
ncbi:hypothetical protein Salat_1007800 [Sesamum alatum]|uniref:MYB transcription factor n=1 Tax=Sesamum alatum TaxID=300844 RepID=A0AAE1YM06_9LAMI|nr:hypothetical protein Salat_1007800 [Sesamum alatum]